MKLLERLLALFSLGVGDVEPVGDPPADPPADAPPADAPADTPPADDDDDESLSALVDGAADEVDSRAARYAKERKREIEAIAEETARRVSRPVTPPPPNMETQWRESEDREYDELRRNGASQQQLAEKQWEINTNRTLRASDTKANLALFQAAEFSDKSEFRALAFDPAQAPYYNAYKDRVEKELAEIRRNGSNVPRITLLDYLMGKDRREGKLKVKAAAKKEAALPRNVTRIERGRGPGVGARGDVRGGAASTRKQQAEKNLTNSDGSYKRI